MLFHHYCQMCQKAFLAARQDHKYCTGACADKARRVRQGHKVGQRGAPKHLDLPDAKIDSMLAAMAAKRRATKSGLRIDPETIWAQRPNTELHKSAVITHGVETL
jgi:hypothetical protein